MTPRKYLICTSPRSGSTLFSMVLRDTGELGMQLADDVTEPLARLRLSYFEGVDWSRDGVADLLERCWNESRSNNGVAGYKLMWHDVTQAVEAARRSGHHRELRLDRPGDYVPKDTHYLLLLRRDTLRQAISWAKALQSAAWSSLEEGRASYRYDYLLIRRCLLQVRHQTDSWRRWFHQLGVEPDVYYYEDFVRDIQTPVSALSERLGVPAPRVSLKEAPLRKQGDAVNDEWRARFERDQETLFGSIRAVAASVTRPDPWGRLLLDWRERWRRREAARR